MSRAIFAAPQSSIQCLSPVFQRLCLFFSAPIRFSKPQSTFSVSVYFKCLGLFVSALILMGQPISKDNSLGPWPTPWLLLSNPSSQTSTTEQVVAAAAAAAVITSFAAAAAINATSDKSHRKRCYHCRCHRCRCGNCLCFVQKQRACFNVPSARVSARFESPPLFIVRFLLD